MRRETLAAGALSALGVGLAAAQAVTVGEETTAALAIRTGPMLAVAAAVTYAGGWAALRDVPGGETDRLLAWTVGGGATVAAVALLAVLGTPVDVAGLLVDGFTGGALLGLLVGVYDVRGRADRDRIQAFAQSVSALNTYGKALNSSQTLDEISALCVEAVEFLVAGDGAAFLLVDETAAEPTVTVVDSTLRGDDELAVLESLATAVEPDEEIEAVRYAEPSVDLGTDSPSAALVIAVETPEGRAMIVSLSTTTEIDYDDEDVDLLETLAAHVSTALSGVETTAPVGVDGD